MPHDVIMPALGVAQDTGLIISWLKQSGDVIKVGDALMEIETDKAVMEVEAQADGYLTSVSAEEGEQVPVGQVVAVIAESADVLDVADSENSQSSQNAPAAVSAKANQSDDKQIIMPALGMAQDTGVIVAWRKNPGDPVIATDILLDVETDKSVMEVEAGHDGYVAAIFADALEEVPVGSTIAIISVNKPDKISVHAGLVPTNAANTSRPTPVGDTVTTPLANNVKSQNSEAIISTGEEPNRILASPKVRRLAAEQGLDLHRLVQHGVPQPFHVADLETLRALSQDNVDVDADASTHVSELPASSILRIDARVPAIGHVAFMEWITTHKEINVPAHMVWIRYATASLRQSTERGTESLIVELRRASGTDGCFVDADQSRLSKPVTQSVDQTPTLILRDFNTSPIVSVSNSARVAPVLTIKQELDSFLISLDYRLGQFDENAAIEFTADFAERVAEPLRHLL